MERAFIQANFLAVGTSLGHLSTKKIFYDWSYHLGAKIGQREGAGVATTSH